ncbi:hypothetical protein DFR86_03570 [Acidianus sulfidivorans JP7]|uniref:Stage II sporulation protein M n=1 Tax=Acidianus sulfidivorans JP7 TaxID=619593 RepID=A0A2U9IL13_9CREN|nr:stage II sporulation protein M [Acidianus sulfidivorans]AWR96722.1 hypothetical protein DFR86_03570 [Acidianus sulfidivorans JP7]
MKGPIKDELTFLSLIIFIIELALFIGASAIPIHNQALASEFNSERNSIVSLPYIPEVFSIFSHNFEISLIEFIPGIGVLMLGASIYSTGTVLSAITTSEGIPGWAAALSLLTLPHSWLELPSYAIATAAGIYLIWKRNVKRFFAMIGFVGLELFFAASIESAEIVVENINITYSYLFWFPAIPLFYALYILYKFIEEKTETTNDINQFQPKYTFITKIMKELNRLIKRLN